MDYCEIKKEDTEILIELKKAVLRKIKNMKIPDNAIYLSRTNIQKGNSYE